MFAGMIAIMSENVLAPDLVVVLLPVAKEGNGCRFKVGRHRRVARVAVLKYKRTHNNAKRESALKELAALSQRHHLGY